MRDVVCVAPARDSISVSHVLCMAQVCFSVACGPSRSDAPINFLRVTGRLQNTPTS
jgi:hypothetical protein